MALNAARKDNLRRLLAPRHIAFIGGADAAYCARQAARSFSGPVWGVNPQRSELGGQPCYAKVKDLPAAPDAVFLATPRAAAVQVVGDLNAMGAGGVACFTAGYGELGQAGKQAERELVQAAGDLALVGPNCYGVISYASNAVLWPFAACPPVRQAGGIALIMQSGMIAANLAINQRSAPLAYVISAGNQGMLAIEDYIEALVDDANVSAFGLYMEGMVSVENFAAAAAKALAAGKPIVLLKAGRSAIGGQLTVSHTGSLSGADQAHQALFDQFGIVRVDSPEVLLETLKFMTISGIPRGNRIAAFTCSGGDGLLVADYCEGKNLQLPRPSRAVAAALAGWLPDIATVSNPLDYTTPLWGSADMLPRVFEAALQDEYDAAIFIQDYAPDHIGADNTHYITDAKSYIEATRNAGIPAAICSDLSENMDKSAREMMLGLGVTPLQGIDRGLDAIRNACDYAAHRCRILAHGSNETFHTVAAANCSESEIRLLNEWQSKQKLKAFGLPVPDGLLLPARAGGPEQAPGALSGIAQKIGFPVAVKLVSEQLAHKSDFGAVALNLHTEDEVAGGISRIRNAVAEAKVECEIQGYLVEAMVENVIHELLVGIKRDAQFGMVMVIASGGLWVELIRDAQTLLLPTNEHRVKYALSNLKCYPLLCGYRGGPQCDMDALVGAISGLADFAEANAGTLIAMDINPLMALADGVVVADALLWVTA